MIETEQLMTPLQREMRCLHLAAQRLSFVRELHAASGYVPVALARWA